MRGSVIQGYGGELEARTSVITSSQVSQLFCLFLLSKTKLSEVFIGVDTELKKAFSEN